MLRFPQVLELSAAINVTDAAFAQLIGSLSCLRELHITGHDRCSGKLTSKSLKLLHDPTKLPRLQRLYITDQRSAQYVAVGKLINKRSGLKVGLHWPACAEAANRARSLFVPRTRREPFGGTCRPDRCNCFAAL